MSEADALVCGLSGADATGMDHSLILQRAPEGAPTSDDLGVYIEFDDQINSAYGCVVRCHLTRQRLSLNLWGQLGSLGSVEGFDVALALKDETYEQIRAGLPHIFRGLAGTLEVM